MSDASAGDAAMAELPTAARPTPATAGAMLRAAREAAGLSRDAVALQLKLASRQVAALEDDDYGRLPGRTFVRGFVRNYARLVHLDAERVVAALPGGEQPALDSPALQSTSHTMGELPSATRSRPGAARWLIPLLLVAIVAVAAVYEFMRTRGDLPPTPPAPSAAVAPSEPAEESKPAAASGTAPTVLPNPVAPAPGEPAKETAAPTGTGAPAAAAVTLLPDAAQVAVEFTYRGRKSSWTQIKDANGQVLVAQAIAGGQTQSFAGTPPLEVVVGNASEVGVRWRGAPVDIAPFTRGDVARFVLH